MLKCQFFNDSKKKGEDMTYEYLLVKRNEGVALNILTRPEKYNAMFQGLFAELRDVLPVNQSNSMKISPSCLSSVSNEMVGERQRAIGGKNGAS
jgi:hypothetical protein